MGKDNKLITNIRNKIYTFRGLQVMIDRDLADIYDIETRRLNEQVRRNIERFPEEFMFQLSKEEMTYWKSQIAISNKEKMGIRKPPLAFTEQGVSMLSAVLKSSTAIKVSIQIINAFVEMRKFIANNAEIFQRLNKVELKQLVTDTKIDKILNRIELNEVKPKQGIFYNGQIFDAYKLVSDIIRTAKKTILLIDNYIDDTTLQLFTKRNPGVKVKLYTKIISKSLQQDIVKFNSQYEKIEIHRLYTSHDRFMVIDSKTVYHFGASLKDLGKKWFAFSILEMDAKDLIEKLDGN